MAFNISDFRATLNRYNGFSKPSNFEVLISAPPNISEIMPARDLRFFCEQCTMPGFQYSTDSVYQDGIGYSENRPVGYQINPLTLTFLSDQKSTIYQFFYEWLKQISQFDLQDPSNQPLNIESYLFDFPSNYATNDMSIYQYDNTGKKIREFNILNAFPKTINSFDVNWSNRSDFQRIVVEIEYRRWSTRIESQIQN